jgi:hypothetical protein
MKKLTLALIALCFTVNAFAGPATSKAARNQGSCPKLYVGPSLGIEQPAGLIGLNIDVPVAEQFSLGAGAGLSSWGFKGYAEARLYFGQCNRGWAIGSGFTHNTGLSNFTTTLPTVRNGDRPVNMDLKPTTNLFVAVYHFFNLGKNGNRLYIDMGYSVRLTDDNYVINDGSTLTADGEDVMRVLAPGGLMIGLGFSFGVVK